MSTLLIIKNFNVIKNSFLSIISNGILDFSKIESKTLPRVDKMFNLKQLVDNVIIMEKPAAIQKKLELIFQHPENIPLVFIGDEYRIQRILINLLGNAIKFTHKGHVKIHLKIARIVDNKNVIIHLYVQDTGIGIPKEKIDFIYEKFARISPSNEGKYRGLGLGLSIVKHLLDEIGGEIEVNSKPDEGTTFVCTFALKVPLINGIQFKGENNNKKINVLIMEDNIVARMAAKLNFEKLDCNVETAETGEKAIEMSIANVYDIIFMDIGLGNTDGFKVTKEIREKSEKNKNTPIVALTAHDENECRERAKEIGMTDYLNKPIETSEIEKLSID